MNSRFIDSFPFTEALKLLADGEFHSGEQLGALLGVSRAAVWKTLKKFELLGVDVTSVKGKGYCVIGGLDLLNKSRIHSPPSAQLNIETFLQLDSTNSYLLRKKSPERNVCLAESQTAGRGRRGRVWVSPFAQNLYLSIGWCFDGGIRALEGLSLAIGLAVVRCMARYGITGLQLKWPNDILYNNQKLGGILIEMSGDPAGHCVVVVGIGINVSMNNKDSQSIEQPWINLNDVLVGQSLPLISRNELASTLLDELVTILSSYQQTGFSAYIEEWTKLAAFINCSVGIHAGSKVQEGIFRGVDSIGGLRLDVQGVEHIVHGGEVSLRGTYVS